MKPTLYYQVNEFGTPYDNFCSDAAIGASNNDIDVIAVEKPPKFRPYNIVIGTVEFTELYLGKKYQPIDHSWCKPFYNRNVIETRINDLTTFPVFIKPSSEIKAWTGIVVNNKEEALHFTQQYDKPILSSNVIDIISEYRVYIIKDRGIIGVKHYLGDPYVTLDKEFVNKCYLESSKNLNENSYTLDFGIDQNNKTFLIEVNDGWAIGNYGLDPDSYYSFVKNRFLQLSGVLK